MLNERLTAARAVRTHFLAAEAAQDDAAILAVRCLATMLEARRTAKLPLGTGLRQIELAARAAALSIEARSLMIESHPELAKLPADIGLGTRLYGDVDECPPVDRPRGAEREPLRVVGAA